MTAWLSEEDASALRRSLEVILDVEAAVRSPEDWATDVLSETIPLFKADRGFVCLPDGDESRIHFNDPEMHSAALDYLSYYQFRDTFLGPRRLELGLTTYICEELITPEEKRTSEHWNDWVVPNRLLDPCAIAIDLPDRQLPAVLTFYHETEDEQRKFGARGKLLLDVMESAFRRTVFERLRRAQVLPLAVRVAEQMPVPLMIFDRRGALIEKSRGFEIRLGSSTLGRAITAHAGALVRETVGSSNVAAVPPPRTRRVICESPLGSRFFDLLLSWVPSNGVGDQLATVAVLDADVPTASQMQEAFGLTARESEVAALLTRRKTNREIASALYISNSTARRHTERVLSKLGVRSRQGVRAVLLRLGHQVE